MLKSSKVKKLPEICRIIRDRKRAPWAQIKVYLESQEAANEIYQNFRLVASDTRFLKYFLDSRFTGYNILELAMSKYYAGNGETILYKKKIVFKNLISVVFEKSNLIEYIPDDTQFEVRAPIPYSEGCISCIYWRKKNKICRFSQKIGIKVKTHCEDFRQR